MTKLFLIAILFLSSHRELKWEDFKGHPGNDENKLAETFYNIRLDEMNWDGKVTFTVTPEFLESKSYTRTDDPKVLRHEQAHFDLAVIYSRLIESALIPYQNQNATKQGRAERIYNSYCEKLRKMEDLYDRETKNGGNPVTQAAWEKAINKEMTTK